jgi:hypothetical protein
MVAGFPPRGPLSKIILKEQNQKKKEKINEPQQGINKIKERRRDGQ